MPRLNPRFARCVFFLFARHPETRELRRTPAGTGVIVGFETGVAYHIYAVTCAHVAPQGASVIRLNTTDGKSRNIELEPDDWRTHPSGSDVAIADITEELFEGDDVSYIQPRLFAEQGFIAGVGLGIGDDGFMLGLYANHPGRDYNRIAAKFGNISLMADENDPIGWKGRPKRPAHLFDIRSRGGFSGSPVFVYRTPDGDLRSIDVDGQRRRTTVTPRVVASDRMREDMRGPDGPDWSMEYDTENNIFLRLLGIHAAQYKEKVKIRKPKKPELEGDDDTIRDGDDLWIEGGTTIVVPAWEIRALLNRPDFIQTREDREERLKRQNKSEPASEEGAGEEQNSSSG
jgi:hypothetical protein